MSCARERKPDREKRSRLVSIACAVVVAAATFLAFMPALGGEWLNWDDDEVYLDNPHWRGLSAASLGWMFTKPYFGHYRPASWLTLAADHALWGMNARGYHLTSNLIHCAGAVLFFFLARSLFTIASPEKAARREGSVCFAAAFAALAFAAHPLRVEKVAWLTARGGVLAGGFLIASTLCYLRAARREERRAGWLVLSLVFFALSLLSKAIAMSFPAALVVLDVYPLRRLRANPLTWFSGKSARVLAEKIPFALLVVPALVFALAAKGRYIAESSASYGMGYRLGPVAYGLTFYLRKALVPIDLLPLYRFPEDIRTLYPAAVASAAAAMGITVVVIVLRRKIPQAPAAWVCYLVLLAPVSGIIRGGPQLVADRYAYLAGMPLAILAGGGVFALLCRPGRHARGRPGVPIAAVAAVTVVCVLAVLTALQARVWRSSESLWKHTLSIDPDCAIAHANLGDVYGSAGEPDRAIEHLARAIALRPGLAKAHNNLGNALRAKGDLDGAIAAYQRAVQLRSDYAKAHYNLGNALVAARRLPEAIDSYERAVAANTDHANAWFNLGNARAMSGDIEGAAGAYREVLRLDPGDVEAQERLARCLGQRGRGRL